MGHDTDRAVGSSPAGDLQSACRTHGKPQCASSTTLSNPMLKALKTADLTVRCWMSHFLFLPSLPPSAMTIFSSDKTTKAESRRYYPSSKARHNNEKLKTSQVY